MAPSVHAMYEVETVPDPDLIFLRVHKSQIDPDGAVIPRAFEEHGGGMSTNWAKYATPESTRQQVIKSQKEPKNYGVLSFVVGEVRQIEDTTVKHTPLPDNQSHTDVTGPGPKPQKPEKLSVYQTMVRAKLAGICNWCLHPAEGL